MVRGDKLQVTNRQYCNANGIASKRKAALIAKDLSLPVELVELILKREQDYLMSELLNWNETNLDQLGLVQIVNRWYKVRLFNGEMELRSRPVLHLKSKLKNLLPAIAQLRATGVEVTPDNWRTALKASLEFKGKGIPSK